MRGRPPWSIFVYHYTGLLAEKGLVLGCMRGRWTPLPGSTHVLDVRLTLRSGSVSSFLLFGTGERYTVAPRTRLFPDVRRSLVQSRDQPIAMSQSGHQTTAVVMCTLGQRLACRTKLIQVFIAKPGSASPALLIPSVFGSLPCEQPARHEGVGSRAALTSWNQTWARNPLCQAPHRSRTKNFQYRSFSPAVLLPSLARPPVQKRERVFW